MLAKSPFYSDYLGIGRKKLDLFFLLRVYFVEDHKLGNSHLILVGFNDVGLLTCNLRKPWIRFCLSMFFSNCHPKFGSTA